MDVSYKYVKAVKPWYFYNADNAASFYWDSPMWNKYAHQLWHISNYLLYNKRYAPNVNIKGNIFKHTWIPDFS